MLLLGGGIFDMLKFFLILFGNDMNNFFNFSFVLFRIELNYFGLFWLNYKIWMNWYNLFYFVYYGGCYKIRKMVKCYYICINK